MNRTKRIFINAHPSLKRRIHKLEGLTDSYMHTSLLCFCKDIYETQMDVSKLKEIMKTVFGWKKSEWKKLIKAYGK